MNAHRDTSEAPELQADGRTGSFLSVLHLTRAKSYPDQNNVD